MIKLVSIILSLYLFSFANVINGGASLRKCARQPEEQKPPTRQIARSRIPNKRALTSGEAFLCCTHPRLGEHSAVGRLNRELLKDILKLAYSPVIIKITNEDLIEFDELIKRISFYKHVNGLDLSDTNVTNEQLDRILHAISFKVYDIDCLLNHLERTFLNEITEKINSSDLVLNKFKFVNYLIERTAISIFYGSWGLFTFLNLNNCTCLNLVSFIMSDFWCTNIKNLYLSMVPNIFYFLWNFLHCSCNNIITLDISGFEDCDGKTFSLMSYICLNLRELNVSNTNINDSQLHCIIENLRSLTSLKTVGCRNIKDDHLGDRPVLRREGCSPRVLTPPYVLDNLHLDLLLKEQFIELHEKIRLLLRMLIKITGGNCHCFDKQNDIEILCEELKRIMDVNYSQEFSRRFSVFSLLFFEQIGHLMALVLEK